MDVLEATTLSDVVVTTNPLDIAAGRVTESGYEIRKQNEALVVGASVSNEEVSAIIDFIKPIAFADLEGHCQERTAESIFSGIATHGYEVVSNTVDGGVIPLSYHIITGKQLADGSFLAFDPVFRSVISGSADNDHNPDIQTVIFSAKDETELLAQMGSFYGMGFQRAEVEDSPYARHLASRETFADR